MFAGDAEQAGGAIRRCPVAGFGAGAETEIDDAATRRGGKLEMRDFVEEDVGFGVGTQTLAVPAEIERGAARPHGDALLSREREGAPLVSNCYRPASALGVLRTGDPGKGLSCRPVAEFGHEAAQHFG